MLTLVAAVGAVGIPVNAIFGAMVVVIEPEPDPVTAPVKVILELTPEFVNKSFTNFVVAIWLLFELAAGAGTVGVPVNEGELMVAFKAKSEISEVMLAVLEAIFPVADVILMVFEETVFEIEAVFE